jgi:hypothetical protein
MKLSRSRKQEYEAREIYEDLMVLFKWRELGRRLSIMQTVLKFCGVVGYLKGNDGDENLGDREYWELHAARYGLRPVTDPRFESDQGGDENGNGGGANTGGNAGG